VRSHFNSLQSLLAGVDEIENETEFVCCLDTSHLSLIFNFFFFAASVSCEMDRK
jgi:hypothetical protein